MADKGDLVTKSAAFITVEGGEGVGKSSFCSGLARQLNTYGLEVLETGEPGGSQLGKAVRSLFLEPPGGEPLETLTELFLVSAARSQHVLGPIKNALEKGSFVICDRFYDSTRVYQGHLGGVEPSHLEHVISASVGDMAPGVTFLLDCDTQVVMERLASRESVKAPNRFDKAPLSYHKKLREGFLEVAKTFSERFEILDASQKPEAIVLQAIERLYKRGLLADK